MKILDGEPLISFTEASQRDDLLQSSRRGCRVSRQTYDEYAKKGSHGVILKSVMTPSGRKTKASWIEEFILELTAKCGGVTESKPTKPNKATRLATARARIKAGAR